MEKKKSPSHESDRSKAKNMHRGYVRVPCAGHALITGFCARDKSARSIYRCLLKFQSRFKIAPTGYPFKTAINDR